MKLLLPLIVATILLVSCNKEDNDDNSSSAQLSFKVTFDPDQQRLNNSGQTSTVPNGNATQTPGMQEMCVHWIELAPNQLTPLNGGVEVYKGIETNAGGDAAIDFDQARIAENGEVFLNVDLSNLPAGTYEWLRTSIAYQKGDIVFNINNIPTIGNLEGQTATLASFLGFNTYISDYTVHEKTLAVNDDRLQGFWAMETNLSEPYNSFSDLYSGQAPANATTVVNPLAGTVDVPPGSCIITGQIVPPLVISGNETEGKTLNLSFSINESIEWADLNSNGELDFDTDPAKNEKLVDMGLRGLIVKVE